MRYGSKDFTEFEDDEVSIAIWHLVDGVYSGYHAIINITNEKGDVIKTEAEIWAYA
jgi:hypothetical protein